MQIVDAGQHTGCALNARSAVQVCNRSCIPTSVVRAERAGVSLAKKLQRMHLIAQGQGFNTCLVHSSQNKSLSEQADPCELPIAPVAFANKMDMNLQSGTCACEIV